MIYGNDGGYGNNKGATLKHGVSLIASQAAYVTRQVAPGTDVDGQADTDVQLVEFDDKAMAVGLGAYRYGDMVGDMDTNRLATGTREVKSIFYAGLADHFQTPKALAAEPLDVYMALPASLLQTKGQRDETQKQVAQWMVGDHAWMGWDCEWSATVASVNVVSQAGAALFDYILDEDGEYVLDNLADARGSVGVLSFGHNTLEYMVIESLKQNYALSGSALIGVNVLLDQIRVGSVRSRQQTDVLLRNDALNGSLSNAIGPWSDMIRAKLREVWRNQYEGFGLVIMVGGGALLARSEIESIFRCRVYVPDEPLTSIASGALKMGVKQQNDEEEKSTTSRKKTRSKKTT